MKRLVPAALAILAAATAGADTRGRPDEDSLARAARLNTQLAVAYLKQNDVRSAREKIERALSQNPRDASVQSAAGLVFDRLQETDKADSHYSTALRLAPDDPDMQMNRSEERRVGKECRSRWSPY